jgi:outer membrane protein assembly factor BamB
MVMRRWIVGLCLAALLAPLAAWAADEEPAAGDWPGWRGPNRDGKSPDTGLLKEWPADGPKLLWKVDSIGQGFSSVAVVAGKVYITGDVDRRLVLFALDLDGKPLWKQDIAEAWTHDHPGARATPTIDGANLYLESGNGLVGCYSAATGKKKWTRELREFEGRPGGWGYAESVLIHKSLAIVKPGGKNALVALDKATGQTKWTSRAFGGPEYGSSIAIPYTKGVLIVAPTHDGICGVDAATGRMLWTNGWSAGNTANCPTPAYSQGYVFWSNGYGKGGICLKLKSTDTGVSATEAWTTHDLISHHGGYIIHEGYIYGNTEGGYVCLDLKTGQKKWFEQAVGKGSLCFADGMLYLFGENGGRAALATCSPDGMAIKGRLQVQGSGPSWAHPVVIGGRLYLRYDKNLYCFDVKAN